MSKNSKQTGATHKILTIIGIVLCVILIPILVMNLVLIVKSYTNKDAVPGIAGKTPMVVLTDSMFPTIKSGDLIIVSTRDPKEVNVGDVIAFFDPQSANNSVVTHRVVEISTENGERCFITQGDANNSPDVTPVPADKLVGVYSGRHFAGLGNAVMFMQSTTGFIVCVICPIILLVGYDLIRRKVYERSAKDDTAELRAELEKLRAEKKALEDSQSSKE